MNFRFSSKKGKRAPRKIIFHLADWDIPLILAPWPRLRVLQGWTRMMPHTEREPGAIVFPRKNFILFYFILFYFCYLISKVVVIEFYCS